MRLLAVFTVVASMNVLRAAPDGAEAEHFEKTVRPILVEHCYRCHSDEGKSPKGGLRIDGRARLLVGGDSGPAIVPGEPAKSRLIDAVRYGNVELTMPPKAKLGEAEILALERWVKAGAPWPGEADAGSSAKGGFDLEKRKAEHRVWMPIMQPKVPTGTKDEVDLFLEVRHKERSLVAAPPATKAVWLRRATFALTGLPPTPAEIAAFEADGTADAYAKVADRLLASPAYGERWARHWLDLVRYAESRGHEFDPDIPNAWLYRDYVVRAFNADVPYNRFGIEHIAGDLVAHPRYDPRTRGNESILGTAFWHLGEEVHSPVDIRQDQADRLDNRIDVLTKTFLGLTVSCARCHDHKFDAITAKDYYALFGLLEGSDYRQVRLDGQRENRSVAKELAKFRSEVSAAFAKGAPARINPAPVKPAYATWRSSAKTILDYADSATPFRPDDVAFGTGPVAAGSYTLGAKGARLEERSAAMLDPFWAGLKVAPQMTHDYGALGKHHRAGFSIRSDSFVLEKKAVYALVRGGGLVYAAIEGHTVISGPLHAATVQALPDAAGYRWIAMPLEGYRGRRAHLEFTADPRTDFAVALVVQADEAPPGVPPVEVVADEAPSERQVAQWTARQADLENDWRVRAVWESRIAPGLWDGNGVDESVFIRGNPKALGAPAPRRHLEALGTEPIRGEGESGRLKYAEELFGPKLRAFAARVYVNRIWQHLFCVGLVPTPDNFGVLGEAPTHPELLDHLALQFIEEGWSTKTLIRRLVLTDAYRRASTTIPASAVIDPTNRDLHAFRVKRLDGESVRDAILQVSGRLDRTLGGKSVPIHLTTFLDGRGRPNGGPLDGEGRRSLYLGVRRNFLTPFLQAFDTPSPFSTVGRRQVSNVPAQALILLNDPFVHGQAELWGKAAAGKPGTDAERVAAMYVAAFGRAPTNAESATVCGFLDARNGDSAAWIDVAHMLFNAKEFLYVR